MGGYAEEEAEDESSAQFDVADHRTLDQVVKWLMDLGYVPSFCTACYREGRTGDRFMSLCKAGQIHNCCLPNALMTLKEYLEDYASPRPRPPARRSSPSSFRTSPTSAPAPWWSSTSPKSSRDSGTSASEVKL